MSEDEILEFIPEPLYRHMLAWLDAGHTGTIVLTARDRVIVDIEMIEVFSSAPRP